MMKPNTLIRLAAVGLAVTAIAACTPRRPVETPGGGTTMPDAGNPQYPGNGNGNVDGGNLGSSAPVPPAPPPGPAADAKNTKTGPAASQKGAPPASPPPTAKQ